MSAQLELLTQERDVDRSIRRGILLNEGHELDTKIDILLRGNKDIRALQNFIRNLDQRSFGGSTFIEGLTGYADCLEYRSNGINFVPGGREFGWGGAPPGKVWVLATAMSVCGTDRGLMKMARENHFPEESVGLVAGHEFGGVVIATGYGVSNCKIGDVVNPDSHVPCEKHNYLDHCSLYGCDGIVSIRGTRKNDGSRNLPPDGYFSRFVLVDDKSIQKVIPIEVAEKVIVPSIFESLGNPYEIMRELKRLGVLDDPSSTTLINIGLGATGYPLAAFATHNQLRVIGIDPSASQRELAKESHVCEEIYENVQDAMEKEIPIIESSGKNVVVTVMSGHPKALEGGMDILRKISPVENGRRILIVFGLSDDTKAPMPYISQDAAVTQRDFVFDRMRHRTEDGIEIVGVCGRSGPWERIDNKWSGGAWENLIQELLVDIKGSGKLVDTLNNGVLQLHTDYYKDPFKVFYNMLRAGDDSIQDALGRHNKVKLVVNFFKRGSLPDRIFYEQ